MKKQNRFPPPFEGKRRMKGTTYHSPSVKQEGCIEENHSPIALLSFFSPLEFLLNDFSMAHDDGLILQKVFKQFLGHFS